MGPAGDAYLRKLFLVRARLRQPQDRRYAVRRGRRVTRNGSAVTHRLPNSSTKSFTEHETVPLSFVQFSIYFFYYVRALVTRLPQDLYENVDYGVLSPQTKIKVKVNPTGNGIIIIVIVSLIVLSTRNSY